MMDYLETRQKPAVAGFRINPSFDGPHGIIWTGVKKQNSLVMNHFFIVQKYLNQPKIFYDIKVSDISFLLIHLTSSLYAILTGMLTKKYL